MRRERRGAASVAADPTRPISPPIFFFFRSCPVRTCARAGSPTSTSHRALTHPTIDSLSSQAINPPDKFRKKTLCFLKLSETEISPDNVDAQVIYGDFGDVPLEHLSVLAQEVFLPMLTNPRNQVGWPEVITKEVAYTETDMDATDAGYSDKIATGIDRIKGDYSTLPQHMKDLFIKLRALAKSEGIDMERTFQDAGGTRFGTITKRLFQSALCIAFQHYTFSQQELDDIVEAYDCGLPDTFAYYSAEDLEIMREMAKALNLRRRLVIPVPVLTPRLSSLWIHLVTPLHASIARPLAEGLRNRVVCRNDDALKLMPHPEGQAPLTIREAMDAALIRMQSGEVETAWSDAGVMPGDPQWAGGTEFVDRRVIQTSASQEALWLAACSRSPRLIRSALASESAWLLLFSDICSTSVYPQRLYQQVLCTNSFKAPAKLSRAGASSVCGPPPYSSNFACKQNTRQQASALMSRMLACSSLNATRH